MTFFERSYESRSCFDDSMSIHLLSRNVSFLSQKVPLVEVLLLPFTWLQPHSCSIVEFALLVDLQDFSVLSSIDSVTYLTVP